MDDGSFSVDNVSASLTEPNRYFQLSLAALLTGRRTISPVIFGTTFTVKFMYDPSQSLSCICVVGEFSLVYLHQMSLA